MPDPLHDLCSELLAELKSVYGDYEGTNSIGHRLASVIAKATLALAEPDQHSLAAASQANLETYLLGAVMADKHTEWISTFEGNILCHGKEEWNPQDVAAAAKGLADLFVRIAVWAGSTAS